MRAQRRLQPDDQPSQRKRPTSISLAYLAAALVSVWLLQLLVAPLLPRAVEIPYSEFQGKLAAAQIAEVTLGSEIDGATKDNTRFVTLPPPGGDSDLIRELGAERVTCRAKTPPSPITSFLVSWVLPLALMMGPWSFAGRKAHPARSASGFMGVLPYL